MGVDPTRDRLLPAAGVFPQLNASRPASSQLNASRPVPFAAGVFAADVFAADVATRGLVTCLLAAILDSSSLSLVPDRVGTHPPGQADRTMGAS